MAGDLLLTLRLPEGRPLLLAAASDDSVARVKTRIHGRVGVPPGLQRLTFAGRELDDEQSLVHLGVRSASQLCLTACLRGGGNRGSTLADEDESAEADEDDEEDSGSGAESSSSGSSALASGWFCGAVRAGDDMPDMLPTQVLVPASTSAAGAAAATRAPDGDEAMALGLALLEELDQLQRMHEQAEIEAAMEAGLVATPHAEGLHAHGGQLTTGFAESEVDVDRMGYEELLQLQERVGNARHSALAEADLALLPTYRLTGRELPLLERRECAICQEAYVVGDELRTLPCLHAFHRPCIDRWLTGPMAGARSCPVCNVEVLLQQL